MPKWYRLNTNGIWQPLANVYRLNTSGVWQKLKIIYRLRDNGNWGVVHSSADLPQIITAPVLQTQGGSTTVFTQIDTITLDRGTWDYMDSAYAPTSYSLQIQSSTTGTGGWTDVATGTGTSISYAITLADTVAGSLYFRGRVTATNENGSTTVTTTPVRSNMRVDISLNGAPTVSDTDIFVAWTITRPTNGTYLSSQKVELFNASTNALLYTANVTPTSATVYSHSIPTSGLPSYTLVYVKVTAVANDSALTQGTATSANFYTPISGTASISPSSSNRVEAGTSVSAVLSNWPIGTTFTYEWKWQQASGTITTISTTNSANVPSASGTIITLSVTGTYNGQTKTATTANHRIHPQAPVYTLTGGSNLIISSVTATGATHYFGSYGGTSSGTITEKTLATNTTISGLSAGSYTTTLFSRAYLNSVAYDSYNSTSKNATIVSLNPPTITGITFSETNTTFTISFTGGDGPYYQIYWLGGPAVPDNASTSYDAAGTSSPVIESFIPIDETTYYFYIRSSTENVALPLNNTTTAGNATPGTFGNWSSAFTITPFAKPTSLSASGNDKTGINLTWSGGAAPEYQINQSTVSTKPTDKTATFSFSAGSTSPFKWTGATRGTTYYFFIRGNLTIPSPATEYYTNWYPTTSPGVSGRAPFYAPGTPTGLTGTVQSSSQIDISWTAPTTNSTQDAASGYDIYYSTSSTAPNAFTTPTTTSTTTSKSITGLSASTTYYFWVRATNVDNTGSNASAWTASINRTTQASLSNPTIVYVKQTGNRALSAVTFSATVSSPATSWVVDYGTSTSYGTTSSFISSGSNFTTSDYAIGTVVYYRLRSYNSATGQYSSGVTGTYTTVRKVTGVTAATYTTAPFVIWTVQAHGMTSMRTYVYKSTVQNGTTYATGANDPILSADTSNGLQTRQTSVTPGGTGFNYYLSFLGCYSGSGGGGSVFDVGLVTGAFTHPGNGFFTVYST